MAMTPLDYEDIRQLLARYSLAVDFGNREEFEACFAPDAYFVETGLPSESPEGGRIDGRASLGEFAERFFADAQGHLRHWSSPPVIEGDGNQAKGRSFLMVLRPGAAPHAGVILTGIYHDRYTKIDGRWHFASRAFCADPQPEHRTNPSNDLLVARFDDFVSGRAPS